MVARAHHVAREQRDVVGHPFGNLAERQVGGGHEQELGLGALKLAQELAVAEDPAVVALVEVAALAEEALVTGGAVGAEDPVAHLDARDGVADGEDLAHVLVPDGEPGLDRDPAVIDVKVGSADAGGVDPKDGVAGILQLGIRLLVDPDLARRLEGDRSHRGGTLWECQAGRGGAPGRRPLYCPP